MTKQNKFILKKVSRNEVNYPNKINSREQKSKQKTARSSAKKDSESNG